MTKITDNLYIGNYTETNGLPTHVDRILCLDVSKQQKSELPVNVAYLRDQIQGELPNTDSMIREAVERLILFIEKGEDCIFLHCAMGMNRTVAIAAAYLVTTGRAKSISGAIRFIESKGHHTHVHADLKKQIERLYDQPNPL